MRKTLIAIFFIFIVFNGTAAQPLKEKVIRNIVLKNDSTAPVVRNFDAQKIADYRKQREFLYDDVARKDTSWWNRFWSWFWGLFESILKKHYTAGFSFLKYMLIFIAAALVVFIVIKIIGLDLKIFTGKAKSVVIPYDELQENIHEINFTEEIDKAVFNGNYRLAVRLSYLNALKLMNDRQLISWQPEKTNHVYVNEITDPGRRQEFNALTKQFEYIWYGEFFIDKEHFNIVRGNFERFNYKAS